MRFDVLTLFPEIFDGYVGASVLKLAIERGLIEVHRHNMRDWATDRHRSVDDRPFGGGPGMVLKADAIVPSVETVCRQTDDAGHLVMLTPQGRRFDQRVAEELATHDRIVLLCGRYEGFDERIREILAPDEISVGDFILNGGETAAMVIIDAVIRLVPDVLGDEQSSREDSFSTENRWLEGAQYTRPRTFRGQEVPTVLLGGNHEEIAKWREQSSRIRTEQRRADLLGPEDGRGSPDDR